VCLLPPQEKLQRRIDTAQIKVLNPPRPGKKCLVLDIDYTIFDLNSTAGALLAALHAHQQLRCMHRQISTNMPGH
jgi:ubiquitin-like domain-containing CTD phosphatase 1